MSHLLYRLGRFSARRPWAVIGSWLLVAVLVITASGAFGRQLEDSFQAPGVDSQKATELLTAAQSDQAGLTAQMVVTPREDDATFFDSAEARVALADVQAGVAALPNVLRTSDPAGVLAARPEAAVKSGAVSKDGRVALIRIHYPVLEELDAGDLENLKRRRPDGRLTRPDTDSVATHSFLRAVSRAERVRAVNAAPPAHAIAARRPCTGSRGSIKPGTATLGRPAAACGGRAGTGVRPRVRLVAGFYAREALEPGGEGGLVEVAVARR